MQIVLIIVLLYLLYRFVIGFVLPVATAAGRIKKQFREMQANQPRTDETMNDPNDQGQSKAFRQSEKPRTTSGKKGLKEDYIDFEEIPASKKY